MLSKWRSRLLWSLAAIALSIALLWGGADSRWGQEQIRTHMSEILSREFGINVTYSSLGMHPGTSGWVVVLQDVRWSYSPESKLSIKLSTPIRKLKISLNPLRLQEGLKAVRRITIEGASLGINLTENSLRIDAIDREFTPEYLSDLISKVSAAPADAERHWPRLFLDDVVLKVRSAPNDQVAANPADFVIAAHTARDSSIEALDIASEGFDAITLAKTIAGFAVKIKGFDAIKRHAEWLDLLAKGRVKGLAIQCRAGKGCEAETEVLSLRTHSQGYIPGVDDLSAKLRWRDKHLLVTAEEGKAELDWKKLYAKPVAIETQKLKVDLFFDESALSITVPQTTLGYQGIKAHAKALITIPYDVPRDTRLEFDATADDTEWKSVLAVLPDTVIGRKTMDLLTLNIHQAKVERINANGRGLARAYADTGSREGAFTINAAIDRVSLEFLKKWPELYGCSGGFLMRNLRIAIDRLSCHSVGVDVASGTVEFPDLSAKPPLIKVGFEASALFEASIAYLKASPLASIAKVTEALGVTALRQITKVSIRAPLSTLGNKSAVKVSGSTQIAQGKVLTPLGLYEGKSEHAALSFDQDGLLTLTTVLKSNFEESQLLIDRETTADRLAIEIKPLEPLESSLQGKAYASPAHAPMLIEGTAAGVKLNNSSAVARVDHLTVRLGDGADVLVVGQGKIADFGMVAQVFGLPDVVKKGHGTANFDLKMLQLGKQSVKESLSGTLDLNIKEGAIDRLPTWMATLVNTANLKSFGADADRVAYKDLSAKLIFDQGLLTIARSSVDAGAVEVRGEGTVNFKADAISLKLTVFPDLGAVPPAVAIGAWNPLVGLALYGLSKIEGKASDSFLNRIVSQTYHLQGPFKNPELHLVSPFGFKEAFR